MDDFNDDPLDLLQDGDDVIDIVTVLNEDEEKPILERTGCLGLVLITASPIPLIYFGLSIL